ncbi:MAG: ATP-grasp fold amidoligase family protein [Pseudomonadota bacterium]
MIHLLLWPFDKLVIALVEKWTRKVARKEARFIRRASREAGQDTYRIAAPRLPNEKFLWRKLFDHNPLFVTMSDKIACKEWIKAQGFALPIPQTLWVGTDAGDIPEDLWKRPIMIKAAHGWQMNIAVEPTAVDRKVVIDQANDFLRVDHGRQHMEWAYDHVPRRLLVEERLFPGCDMIDVKYYTFGERIERIVISRFGPQVVSGRWLLQSDGSYALDDVPTSVSPVIDQKPLPPVVYENMAVIRDIGARFDHVRVDTMTNGETLFLGELTVYTQAGRLSVDAFDQFTHMNRSWDLRRSWFLTAKQTGWRGVYAGALRRTIDRRQRAGHGLA